MLNLNLIATQSKVTNIYIYYQYFFWCYKYNAFFFSMTTNTLLKSATTTTTTKDFHNSGMARDGSHSIFSIILVDSVFEIGKKVS